MKFVSRPDTNVSPIPIVDSPYNLMPLRKQHINDDSLRDVDSSPQSL